IFYGNAIAAACAAIVFIYFFRNRKARTEVGQGIGQKEIEEDKPVRNAYKDSLFIVFNILCCLFSMAFFQLLSTLPLFYKEAHNLHSDEIGLLLGFSGFVIVLFEMVLVHVVEHRFSVRQIMLWGTAIAGVSYLMLNIDFGIAWLFFAMFLLSTGEMLTLPFTATVAIQRAGKRNQGAYMGLNSLSFATANIFAAYLGTYLAEHYGYSTLWLVTGSTLIICGFGFYWIIGQMKTV